MNKDEIMRETVVGPGVGRRFLSFLFHLCWMIFMLFTIIGIVIARPGLEESKA